MKTFFQSKCRKFPIMEKFSMCDCLLKRFHYYSILEAFSLHTDLGIALFLSTYVMICRILSVALARKEQRTHSFVLEYQPSKNLDF